MATRKQIRSALPKTLAASSIDQALGWRSLVTATAISFLWLASAWAKKDEIQPNAPKPPAHAPKKFHIAVGAAATTDYMSRGITQSDSKPAIQGYIEPKYSLGPSLGDLFVNVWSSNVDFGSGIDGAEIDVAGGIMPKFLGPQWSPTIGYVQYVYAPGGINPNYGEIFAQTDYSFGQDDKFTIRGLVFFAPNYNQSGFTATWVSGAGRVKPWKNVDVYAGAGYQFWDDPSGAEQLAWVAGVSYYWKSLTFDVRYWDTNLADAECLVVSGFRDGCDARVVGTISVDTTWSALFDGR